MPTEIIPTIALLPGDGGGAGRQEHFSNRFELAQTQHDLTVSPPCLCLFWLGYLNHLVNERCKKKKRRGTFATAGQVNYKPRGTVRISD